MVLFSTVTPPPGWQVLVVLKGLQQEEAIGHYQVSIQETTGQILNLCKLTNLDSGQWSHDYSQQLRTWAFRENFAPSPYNDLFWAATGIRGFVEMLLSDVISWIG